LNPITVHIVAMAVERRRLRRFDSLNKARMTISKMFKITIQVALVIPISGRTKSRATSAMRTVKVVLDTSIPLK